MDAKLFVQAVGDRKAALIVANQAAYDVATAEEKKAMEAEFTKKAKHYVKDLERADALTLVLTTIKAVAADDPALMSAVALLTPNGPRAPGAPKEAKIAAPRIKKTDIVSDLFPTIDTVVHEDVIYASYKLGRPDFGRVLRHQIKDAKDAADRKWISFDPASGNYTFVAQGPDAPEGWTGYTPKMSTPEATDKAASADPVQGTAEEALF